MVGEQDMLGKDTSQTGKAHIMAADAQIFFVSQVIQMIACRFMDANGNGSREQAIKCIDWCLGKDVHVLSNSWGEVPDSPSLQVRSSTCSAK